MNRNKKGVMPEITREVYKNVKKYTASSLPGSARICTSTDTRTAGRAFRE